VYVCIYMCVCVCVCVCECVYFSLTIYLQFFILSPSRFSSIFLIYLRIYILWLTHSLSALSLLFPVPLYFSLYLFLIPLNFFSFSLYNFIFSLLTSLSHFQSLLLYYILHYFSLSHILTPYISPTRTHFLCLCLCI